MKYYKATETLPAGAVPKDGLVFDITSGLEFVSPFARGADITNLEQDSKVLLDTGDQVAVYAEDGSWHLFHAIAESKATEKKFLEGIDKIARHLVKYTYSTKERRKYS